MDREKTINELEQLKKFAIKNDMPGIEKTTKSAIELLKEQEAVEPICEQGSMVCGECHGRIGDGWNYCSSCGSRINWDGWKE